MAITILVTDNTLTTVGDPIVKWTNIEVTLRFNQPASGTLTVPSTPALLDQLQPGRRIVVVRDGAVFCAGPIEVVGPQTWSVEGGDSGSGTHQVAFSDDLASVLATLTFPSPGLAATAQTVVPRWTATGPAGGIIRDLVNLNRGPGALAARRIPQLIIGTQVDGGTSITFGTRFQPLGDALRSAAIAGGGLGFRTRQVVNQIVFEVYQPVDRSAQIRFSRGLKNLRSFSYQLSAPTATVAIVGGQDEGVDRVVVERVDLAGVAQWGRYEVFVDQRQSDDALGDTAELEQAGDEALISGAATAQLTAKTIDGPDQQFGVHYGLGDLASVEDVADIIRAVTLTATPDDGEQITATVGASDSSSDPAFVAAIRALAARVGRLETR